jgi:hypothetical protein
MCRTFWRALRIRWCKKAFDMDTQVFVYITAGFGWPSVSVARMAFGCGG